ncbi:MAG TPA: bifunctional phosphoribosylaminoimidazolecarboxamide formyltransferase/IMP cyclohydrolase [Limnochordales bacterium]
MTSPTGNGLRRALMSVSDTQGLVELAGTLSQMGWEIWATDGTASHLEAAGVAVRRLAQLTGHGTLLGGRVKSLHPAVFAGVLARPDETDLTELERLGGVAFDWVVVNFYPFGDYVARLGDRPPDVRELVEFIDIGGPALVRAAAKNHDRVAVVTDPSQYPALLDELRRSPSGQLSPATRRRLAVAAFRLTAAYDALVATTLERIEAGEGSGARLPDVLHLVAERWRVARYGENPHQSGAIYRIPWSGPSVPWGNVLQGKELSYNNVADASAALELILELADRPAACAIKHGSPCGAAVADTLARAYERCYEADPVSIFGGVVALSRPVDAATAQLMERTFLEVIVAPSFEPDALAILAKKPRLRLIEVGPMEGRGRAVGWPTWEVRSVPGGLLVQTPDELDLVEEQLRTVTQTPVPDALWPDLRFAWRVVKHARSNAIVVARDGQTLGIGAGQVNRIDAARQALQRAGARAAGAVLASDGFFPFSDVVELAAEHGIAAIIQPGGSMRDHESVTAADRAGLPMVFTGVRHFRH